MTLQMAADDDFDGFWNELAALKAPPPKTSTELFGVETEPGLVETYEWLDLGARLEELLQTQFQPLSPGQMLSRLRWFHQITQLRNRSLTSDFFEKTMVLNFVLGTSEEPFMAMLPTLGLTLGEIATTLSPDEREAALQLTWWGNISQVRPLSGGEIGGISRLIPVNAFGGLATEFNPIAILVRLIKGRHLRSLNQTSENLQGFVRGHRFNIGDWSIPQDLSDQGPQPVADLDGVPRRRTLMLSGHEADEEFGLLFDEGGDDAAEEEEGGDDDEFRSLDEYDNVITSAPPNTNSVASLRLWLGYSAFPILPESGVRDWKLRWIVALFQANGSLRDALDRETVRVFVDTTSGRLLSRSTFIFQLRTYFPTLVSLVPTLLREEDAATWQIRTWMIDGERVSGLIADMTLQELVHACLSGSDISPDITCSNLAATLNP